MGKNWSHSFAPYKPSAPQYHDTERRIIVTPLATYGPYVDVNLDELISLRDSYEPMEHAENINFTICAEDNGQGEETQIEIEYCVTFTVPLTLEEKTRLKALNDKIRDDYSKAMSKYNLQMKDYEEAKKALDEKFKENRRKQYLELKKEFEK
jgi:hypothetical protein